jgi:hypothetical protein
MTGSQQRRGTRNRRAGQVRRHSTRDRVRADQVTAARQGRDDDLGNRLDPRRRVRLEKDRPRAPLVRRTPGGRGTPPYLRLGRA